MTYLYGITSNSPIYTKCEIGSGNEHFPVIGFKENFIKEFTVFRWAEGTYECEEVIEKVDSYEKALEVIAKAEGSTS